MPPGDYLICVTMLAARRNRVGNHVRNMQPMARQCHIRVLTTSSFDSITKVFQLALKSMGQKNVIRGWGYKRFLAARRALERAGLLEQIRGASTGKAALYKLIPMRLHPIGRSK